MTVGAAPPPPPAFPPDYGPDNQEYGFPFEGWEEIPSPNGVDWFKPEERYRRNANAAVYRENGDPIAWTRYLTLGFFALDDCVAFERIWANREHEPLTLHRVIWYNFMYHVEKDIHIPEKLNAWAMNISHAYLAEHDAESLDVDILTKWKNPQSSIPMETDDYGEWLPVQGSRRHRNKSPTKPPPPPTSPPKLTVLNKRPPKQMHALPLKPGENVQQAARRDWNLYRKLVQPASKEPQMSTVSETDEDDTTERESRTFEDTTMNSQPDSSTGHTTKLPKLPPFPNVSVNDGTHRIKVKWTVAAGVQQFDEDSDKLNDSIFSLLKAMFQDDDGMIYKWESIDTQQSAILSTLNSTNLRDYISPVITTLRATQMIIFGVRYGFTTNPIKWQLSDTVKRQLKEHQVEVTVSNSSSISGPIVNAGCFILKAPNTTSPHRFLQFVRSLLPDITPYFDIVRYKKTPSDQIIPHLVVQCGEKHVAAVCQALVHEFNGKRTAIFIPRYAVDTALSKVQLEKHFQIHQKWARSLKALTLAPTIFHLDQQRTEYFEDGTTLARSTREWATSLKLVDGNPALCDVVNGTSDKKALLLVPSHYFAQAQQELRNYRSRLSPPSHREARFRDTVPNLPDIIHIQTMIEPSVSFLDNLMTSDTWQNLPDPPRSRADRRSKPSTKQGSDSSRKQDRQNAWNKPPNIMGSNKSSRSIDQFHSGSVAEDSRDHARQPDPLEDDRSTSSTQGTTLASDSSFQAKLAALELDTKSKLRELDHTGKKSLERLQQLEKQFTKFEDMEHKLDNLETNLQQVTKHLDDSVGSQQIMVQSLDHLKNTTHTQFAQFNTHLITNGENINHLTTAISSIRNEMTQLSTYMQSLAARQYAQEQSSTRQASPPSCHPTLPPDKPEYLTQDVSLLPTAAVTHEPASSGDDTQLHAVNTPLPDSSDNSVESSSSQMSQISEPGSVPQNPSRSKLVITVNKSPPPKRTRQVDTHPSPRYTDVMELELTPSSPFNMEIPSDAPEPTETDPHQTLRSNLDSRFAAVDNSTSSLDEADLAITSSLYAAPLHPRNTNNMGPAGAENE